jgi:hypothetical protein
VPFRWTPARRRAATASILLGELGLIAAVVLFGLGPTGSRGDLEDLHPLEMRCAIDTRSLRIAEHAYFGDP